MEKGIFKFTPSLKCELKDIGYAYINLCNTLPSLHIFHNLYETNSINGLNLSLFVTDKKSDYKNYELKLSYDVKIIEADDTNVELLYPNGSVVTYKLSGDSSFFNSVDKTVIYKDYNEETCQNMFVLEDEDNNILSFIRVTNNIYGLNEIKSNTGICITVRRYGSLRPSVVECEATKEKITFTYQGNYIYAKIFRKNSVDEYIQTYEFEIMENVVNNLISVSHTIFNENQQSREYKNISINTLDNMFMLISYKGEKQTEYKFNRRYNKIISFVDENKVETSIDYNNQYAIVTNNFNDEEIKYCWDSKGRLTHIYNQKNDKFNVISYDTKNNEVIVGNNIFSKEKYKFNGNYIGSADAEFNLKYPFNYTAIINRNGQHDEIISVLVNIDCSSVFDFEIELLFEDENGELHKSKNYKCFMESVNVLDFVYSTVSPVNYKKVIIGFNSNSSNSPEIKVYGYNSPLCIMNYYVNNNLASSLYYNQYMNYPLDKKKNYENQYSKVKYDDKGRIESLEDYKGNKISYTYDNNGNKKTAKYVVDDTIIENHYNYDSYNRMIVDKNVEDKSYLEKTYSLNNLLVTTKLIEENIIIDSSNNIFSHLTMPNISRTTHNAETINYSYENEELKSISANTMNYITNRNSQNNCVDNVKLNDSIIEEYSYKSLNNSDINVLSSLLESQTFEYGVIYIEYNDDKTMSKIKYKENNETEQKTLYSFDYTTINGDKYVTKVNMFDSNASIYAFKKYVYDEKGDCYEVNTHINESDVFLKMNSNSNQALFVNEKNTLLYKNLKMVHTPEKNFASYVRGLSDNIKLCCFDKSVDVEYTLDEQKRSGPTKLVAYNDMIDICVDDDDNKNVAHHAYLGVGEGTSILMNDVCDRNHFETKKDIPHIRVCGKNKPESSNSTRNLTFIFDDSNNPLSTDKQTIAFMFKNWSNVSTSNVLLGVYNKDDITKGLYIHLNRESISNNQKTVIRVCKIEKRPNEVDFITIEGNRDDSYNSEPLQMILENEEDKWRFISLSYSKNSISLYIDGEELKLNLEQNMDVDYNVLQFGFYFPNNYDRYGELNGSNPFVYSAEFELSNIMIPYRNEIAIERLNHILEVFNLGNKFLIEETNMDGKIDISHYFLSNENNLTNTEYISLNKSFRSSGDLKPEYDYSKSFFDNGYNRMFFFDNTSREYSYGLSGKSIKYVLDDDKYKDDISISCSFKSDLNQSKLYNLMAVGNQNFFLRVSSLGSHLKLFVNGNCVYISESILTSSWGRVTLIANKLYDNCSNQVYQFKLKLSYEGVLLFEDIVECSYLFDGFKYFYLDFSTSSILTPYNHFEYKCFLKDVLITEGEISGHLLKNNNNNILIESQTDTIGRNNRDLISINDKSLNHIKNFNNKTLNLDGESFEYGNGCFQFMYAYDSYGRIESKISPLFDCSIEYEYDSKGQITEESIDDSQMNGDLIINYEYDLNGNILNVKENDITKNTFTYDIHNRIVSIDGNPVTYEDTPTKISFLPKTMDGMTFLWKGRTLEEITTNYIRIKNKYNEQDLRVFKSMVTNHTILNYEYFYDDDGKLLCEKRYEGNYQNIHMLNYIYHNSILRGFYYDNEPYFYLRDSFGIIHGILNKSGELIHQYKYNAFGKQIDNHDGLIDNIGSINPFRYKGYYFDSGSGLYYCNSRYYSPELCRFISPDSIEYLDPESINGLNLYCYCMNNPIMYADPSGHFPFFLFTALLAVGITAAVDYIPDQEIDLHWGWYVGAAVLGTAVGLGVSYYATGSAFSKVGKVFSGLFGKTTLYRSVGLDELDDIQKTGRFNLGNGSMEAKQFGLSLDETKAFGNWANQSNIVSTKIPNRIFYRLDFTPVDVGIFKSGIVTVQSSMLNTFNNSLLGIMFL